MSAEMLTAALAYCPRTVPLTTPDAPDAGAGKRPAVTDWPNWKATPAAVSAYWERHPNANVGMRTGDGLLVLDVDPRNGGDDALAQLVASHGPIPETPEVLTGGGGRHLYFRAPLGTRSFDLAAGVEVKADGRQVVAPPSIHPSGRAYVWHPARPFSPRSGDYADSPAWMLRAGAQGGPAGRVSGSEWAQLLAQPIGEGSRHTTLARLVGHWLGHGLSVGEVGQLAQLVAEHRAAPPLPLHEVERLVLDLARADRRKGTVR